MTKKIKVGIIGATSYTAGKLIQLLLSHPNVEITYLSSDSEAGTPAHSVHKFLTQLKLNLVFEETDYEKAAILSDAIFITKPYDFFHKFAHLLFEKEVKVIDLSADFRLKDPKLYSQWYGFEHKNVALLKKSVYGLSEIYKSEIASAKLIANPGCYPISIILGLIPALKRLDVVNTNNTIIVNSTSGISGAGRALRDLNMFINVAENVRPYKIGVHQHTPEIEQELSKSCGNEIKILFAPQVGPYKSGIVSNIFFSLLDDKFTTEEIYQIYKDFYKNKPFIRVYPPDTIPEVQNVYDTNFCDIGITVDKRTNKCIITSVIDNIVKGASGQAIQNMNIAFGIDETVALPYGELRQK